MNSDDTSRAWSEYREATIRFEQASAAVSRHDRYRSVPSAQELQREREAWVSLEAARKAYADSMSVTMPERRGPIAIADRSAGITAGKRSSG